MCRTYYYGHARALCEYSDCQQRTHNLPSIVARLLPAKYDDNESNNGRKLDDDREGHEKADTAPHATEGGITLAVVVLGEGIAASSDRGTALVEAVGEMRRGAGALCKRSEPCHYKILEYLMMAYIVPSYPSRHYDASNSHGRRCGCIS
jgi:hypothetical protein